MMQRLPRLLFILLIADLCLSGAYLLWVHQVVDHPLPDTRYDAGVIFFAGDPALELNAESRRRTAFGADLYTQGRVSHLVCVGGYRQSPNRFGAEMMAAYLRKLGVPEQVIVVDRRSYDTVSNWRSAVTILEQQGWQHPLLISGPLHLARIQYIATDPFPITLAPARSIGELLREAPLSAWLGVHREWLAWAVMALLPQQLHQDLLRVWRNLGD